MENTSCRRKLLSMLVVFSAAVILLFVGEALFCRRVYTSPSAPYIRFSKEEYLWLWESAPKQYPEKVESFLCYLNIFVMYLTYFLGIFGIYPLVLRKGALLSVPLRWKVLLPAATATAYIVFWLYIDACAPRYVLWMDLFLPAVIALDFLLFYAVDRHG